MARFLRGGATPLCWAFKRNGLIRQVEDAEHRILSGSTFEDQQVLRGIDQMKVMAVESRSGTMECDQCAGGVEHTARIFTLHIDRTCFVFRRNG